MEQPLFCNRSQLIPPPATDYLFHSRVLVAAMATPVFVAMPENGLKYQLVTTHQGGRHSILLRMQMCLKSLSFFRHIVNKQHRLSLTTFAWRLPTAHRHQNRSIHRQRTQLRQMYRRQTYRRQIQLHRKISLLGLMAILSAMPTFPLETSLAGSFLVQPVLQRSATEF